jgi:hypothetical protein
MRLASADFRTEQFINQNIIKWTEQTVLDSIYAFAKAAQVPDAYIASLKVVQTGWMKADVILDYFEDGKPLGLWFEYGTKPHGIQGNPFLAFFWEKLKKFVVFHRINHPGQKGLYIMTRGTQMGKPRLKAKIIAETTKFLEESKIP